MTDDAETPKKRELDPLDPENPPPIDRFCDVVLDGGVINGVVYPGFLVELARKFRFRSIGGTSVGAIAAALAAACEYNRRYGSDNGFNEGLAKMPGDLADRIDESKKITRIRSLFQPDPKVQRIFNWFVELLGSRLQRANIAAENRRESDKKRNNQPQSVIERRETTSGLVNWIPIIFRAYKLGVEQFGAGPRGMLWWALAALDVVLCVEPFGLLLNFVWWASIFLIGTLFLHPFFVFCVQVLRLLRMPGNGACTGMRAEGSQTQGLSEWLHEGVQKSANLPLHKPLTFGDLWAAPGGPSVSEGAKDMRSIDLHMITTCLSHGRIYELPLAKEDAGVVMFKLSELKPYFPVSVINHLRRVSKPVSTNTCVLLQRKINDRRVILEQLCEISLGAKKIEKFTEFLDKLEKLKNRSVILDEVFKQPEDPKSGLTDPDIRELPSAELPIVVAARLSLSVPVLFRNVPLIGFNLDTSAEDIDLVRLWFSDGGIGSNFPIHIFDNPIPRWPTFGLKILDVPPRTSSSGAPVQSEIPYRHNEGAEDNLMFTRDVSAFTALNEKSTIHSFIKMLVSIYTSAKDGHDQSFLRMPDVRNRVVRIYMNNRAGNMLNLKIEPDQIIDLALDVGARGGRNVAAAYLAQVPDPKYADWVNIWQDHRWVRLNMLTQGLRRYLNGFTRAVNMAGLPETSNCNTLREQIVQAVQQPPLRSKPGLSGEATLTQVQSDQLLEIVDAISALEQQLNALNVPQPYVPNPMPVLRFKPQY